MRFSPQSALRNHEYILHRFLRVIRRCDTPRNSRLPRLFRIMAFGLMLGVVSLYSAAGEESIRFDSGPLIKGLRDGKNHIYSIGVENPGGRRILVKDHPLLVLDITENKVFRTSIASLKKKEKFWILSMDKLADFSRAQLEVNTEKDKLTHFHISWPGHSIKFAIKMDSQKTPPQRHPKPVRKTPTRIKQTTPPHVAGTSNMKPIGCGLHWSVPDQAGKLHQPKVKEVPTPRNLPSEFHPVGKSYRIDLRGPALSVPVELVFPLPASAFKNNKHIAVIRSDRGRHSIMAPLRIDPRHQTVTVATTHFSTWTEVVWNPGYIAAEVTGNISLRAGCEEVPHRIYFEVTRTSEGEYGNFPVAADHPGAYRVYPPIPETLFGTYSFHGLTGFSDNFIFGHINPEPSQDIITTGHYVQDLELVPISGRLIGRIVDQEGKGVEGARITLLQGESVHPSATSGAGGHFKIGLIGLYPPSADPAHLYPVAYLITKGEDACDSTEGTVKLKAGVTTNKTLTFEPRGELRGVVRDREDEPVAGARIELVDHLGKTHNASTSGSGDYLIEEIPTGLTFVTATCPKGEDEKYEDYRIRCKENDQYQRLDFTLDCSNPGTYRLSVHIGRGSPMIVEARIDGSLKVSISKDGRISGSGKGTFQLTAAGGACKGTQPIVIQAKGQRNKKNIQIDLEFDDGGAALSWKCSGFSTSVPESVDSLEDEGRRLKLQIDSKSPLRASLNRTIGPAGPAQFFTKITLKEE